MVNAQEFVKKNCRFRNSTLQELKVKGKKLEGSLKLEEFTSLEKLDCRDNLITELDLRGCSKINKLYCSNNPLEKLYLDDVSETDWEKIKDELKDCLKKKKDKQYYDLREWKKKQIVVNLSSEIVERTSSVAQLTTNRSDNSNTHLLELTSYSPLSTDSEEITNKSITSQTSLQETNSTSSEKESVIVTEFELMKNEFKNLTKELVSTKNRVDQLEKQLTYLSLINEHRNILLIGRTGKGKSTLANVLSDSDEFKESFGMASQTCDFQAKSFSWKGLKYQVIDTPGIDDTNLKPEEVLDRIIEAAYFAKEGINQVLFVTRGRFDKIEAETYKLAEAIFSDKKETDKYITIVRTDFAKFRKEKECEKDIKSMFNSNEELSSVIKKAYKRGKIIYVNNPSVDDEEEKWMENAKEREFSRSILLEHLEKNRCEIYKPQNLAEFNSRISDYMKERKELEKQLTELESGDKGQTESESERIELIKSDKNNIQKKIHQSVIEFLQEKNVKWTDVVEIGVGAAGVAATVASIVVPLACKIM